MQFCEEKALTNSLVDTKDLAHGMSLIHIFLNVWMSKSVNE